MLVKLNENNYVDPEEIARVGCSSPQPTPQGPVYGVTYVLKGNPERFSMTLRSKEEVDDILHKLGYSPVAELAEETVDNTA